MKTWMVTLWLYRDKDAVKFTAPAFQGTITASSATLAIHRAFKGYRKAQAERVRFGALKAKAVRV